MYDGLSAIEEHSGQANEGATKIIEKPGNKFKAYGHVHPNDSAGTYSIFSFGDIRRFANVLHNNNLDSGTFVAFLSTKKGTHYAMTIHNTSKFLDFFYYFNNDASGSMEQITKWLNSEKKAYDLEKEYYKHPTNPLISQTDTDNANVLEMFLDFMNEANMGISLFETDAAFENFSRVTKKSNGDVDRKPCGL